MRKLFNNIWFKCISVLLAVIICSGGLIAVLSDVLYVSPEVRTKRALIKIYGEEKSYSVVIDTDSTDDAVNSPIEYEKGKIDKIYIIDKENETDGEYDFVFKSTGYEGYKSGNVTLWVKVSVNGGNRRISKVILENYTKQTLMSKLGNGYYDTFLTDVTDGYFTADKDGEGVKNVVTGATKSATAGVNAVNCVIAYLEG
ncbi:MAG: hypothetical protein J5697_01600 [Clostridia bacterium]|nr:hypothetical protein [Clostridia bacterium]